MADAEKIKIALIEDEEVLSGVLENKLKREGFDVFSARDGEAGLSLVRAVMPDLILLDIIMPKMDGFEVLAHLREDPNLAKIPVIIISNSGQPVEIEKAVSMGVKDCLIKAEFDPQEVLSKIKNQLKSAGKDVNAARPSPGEAPPAEKIDPKKFRVLVVEDDSFLRDLISRKLVKEGFQVLQAVEGEEGLKKAIEEKPHIVLLDLILPGMDGFEVLKKIRADASSANIPVIILSNLGQKDDIERGTKLGATDYLVKAHNTPGEIVDKVKAILAKAH